MVLLIAVVVGPQYWVKQVMHQHGKDRPDFPGTGGELASHLAEHYKIPNLTVAVTDEGSHYNPETKHIGLTEDVFNGSSVTAVAIAAHEFGHALQDFGGEAGLRRRQSLVGLAMFTDKVASVFFLAAPLLGLLTRAPVAFLLMGLFGISLLGVRILVHLVTLPVEYDASFSKALPILKEGGYLSDSDLPAARSVLKAAALTYVAGAMMSLLDLARWIRILR